MILSNFDKIIESKGGLEPCAYAIAETISNDLQWKPSTQGSSTRQTPHLKVSFSHHRGHGDQALWTYHFFRHTLFLQKVCEMLGIPTTIGFRIPERPIPVSQTLSCFLAAAVALLCPCAQNARHCPDAHEWHKADVAKTSLALYEIRLVAVEPTVCSSRVALCLGHSHQSLYSSTYVTSLLSSVRGASLCRRQQHRAEIDTLSIPRFCACVLF